MALAEVNDPTTVREEVDSSEYRLRPGDLATAGCVDGRRTAIDVGVTSQDRKCVGDSVHEYAVAKSNKYTRRRHGIHPEQRRLPGGNMVAGRTPGGRRKGSSQRDGAIRSKIHARGESQKRMQTPGACCHNAITGGHGTDDTGMRRAGRRQNSLDCARRLRIVTPPSSGL